MVYREEQRDLFTVPDDYSLAHCISADFAMGAGIAVEFVWRFGTKDALRNTYPHYEQYWADRASRDQKEEGAFGDCLSAGRVLNLVTKRNYWSKPTYSSMRMSLEAMKKLAMQNGITKIAMPKIGCGLDRLSWNAVRSQITEVFQDTDIEILVCEKHAR